MVYFILLGFITLDIVSGFSAAAYKHEISSQIMRKGIFHKFAYAIIVSLATLCDYGAEYLELGIPVNITPFIIAYLCGMEIVSTLENVTKMLPDEKGFETIKDLFKVKTHELND